MNSALKLNIKGIKCDVCDYRNDEVKVGKYEEWLNKPCPKCGTNLLTQEDFDNTKMLISFTQMMNSILPKSEDNEESVNIAVKMNGTGSMDFEVENIDRAIEHRINKI